MKGRIQDFQIEGVQEVCARSTLPERDTQSPLRPRVLDTLSYYLSLILKHSYTKLEKKKIIVDQNLEGALTYMYCAPAWICHCIWVFLHFPIKTKI